jgi:hypothetical protein
MGASSVVLRDHEGVCLAVVASWKESCLDVLVAEAVTACDGLKLAVESQAQRVHQETNCQELVKLWE